jgi:hypothetical protein
MLFPNTLHTLAHACEQKDDTVVKRYYKTDKLFQGNNRLRNMKTLGSQEINLITKYSHTYISYLFDLYLEYELCFIGHCQTLNKYLEKDNNDVLYSLRIIVLKMIERYQRRQNDIKCLYFLQTLFDNVLLYSKQVVTDILHYYLLYINDYNIFGFTEPHEDIIRVFYPYISPEQNMRFDYHKDYIYTELSNNLEVYGTIPMWNIDLPLFFLRSHYFNCLRVLKEQKYNLYRSDLEYDFDWELACQMTFVTGAGMMANKEYDDLYSSELNKIKIYNARQVRDLIMESDLPKYSIQKIKENLPFIDLNKTYMGNVSPIVMCNNKEVLEFIKECDMNLSNDNGVFYFLALEEFQLEFMKMGIDPVPSIKKYKKKIEEIKEENHILKSQYQEGLEALLNAHEEYKKELYQDLRNNDWFCNDITKLIISEYL